MNVNFYDRVFRVCDCDDFTRYFYEYMGVPLNPSEPIPTDSYGHYKEMKGVKINPPDMKEYKEYNEVKLQGGHPNGGL